MKPLIFALFCFPVFSAGQTVKPANKKSANWANELKTVLPKVFTIADKADEPVSKLIAKRPGEHFAATINLPGSKRTYVSKGGTRWNDGKGYTWWSWIAWVDTAAKGTEPDRLRNSFTRLKNELKTLYPAFEKKTSKPETSAEYSFGNDVYLFANLAQGPDYSGTCDYVQLYITFLRESTVEHQKLVDSIKQNMIVLVNYNQLAAKEIAEKIIKEAKSLEKADANPTSISELIVEIFSVAAGKNIEIAFELYLQWWEEKDIKKMKAKLSSSQSDQFKILAQRVLDKQNNKTNPNTQTTTVEKKVDVPKYDPAKDASCVFKAGAFLRYKDDVTRRSSSGLDAYVVSCANGYYKIITRKYVPGEKTLFAQNKNISHYMISESSADRGYIEKEYALSYDYKAGKKISVCAKCRGIGAEYYAEQLVNGKWESVNVTHIMSSLNANTPVAKNVCSKCSGAGWEVQK